MQDEKPMTISELSDHMDTLDRSELDQLLCYAYGFSPDVMTQAVRLQVAWQQERAERYAAEARKLQEMPEADGPGGVLFNVGGGGVGWARCLQPADHGPNCVEAVLDCNNAAHHEPASVSV